MASIRKKENSKYWFACITLPNGKQIQRSLKEIDRRKAQKLADGLEEATRKQMTARQMQSVIADLYRTIIGTPLRFESVRDYFQSWRDRKKPETAPTTFIFYKAKSERFLKWLGDRADQQISRLKQADVLAYRQDELARVSPPTVNHEIKCLRMIFKAAKDDGLLAENPADAVKNSRRTDRKTR